MNRILVLTCISTCLLANVDLNPTLPAVNLTEVGGFCTNSVSNEDGVINDNEDCITWPGENDQYVELDEPDYAGNPFLNGSKKISAPSSGPSNREANSSVYITKKTITQGPSPICKSSDVLLADGCRRPGNIIYTPTCSIGYYEKFECKPFVNTENDYHCVSNKFTPSGSCIIETLYLPGELDFACPSSEFKDIDTKECLPVEDNSLPLIPGRFNPAPFPVSYSILDDCKYTYNGKCDPGCNIQETYNIVSRKCECIDYGYGNCDEPKTDDPIFANAKTKYHNIIDPKSYTHKTKVFNEHVLPTGYKFSINPENPFIGKHTRYGKHNTEGIPGSSV